MDEGCSEGESKSVDRPDVYPDDETLDMATQKTRFTLIQGFLNHPEQMPSLWEFELMNPSLGRTTIHEHLAKFIKVDVIERVKTTTPVTTLTCLRDSMASQIGSRSA